MAVNTITFGNVNSADFGIYISGEGVFNAPVRDADMISIPGRNGSFLLDKGRFENIEVTYRAFNTEANMATFIANVDAFRNAIVSQKGYQRLEDTFHTDEYRMASFIGGLEINPVLYNDHTSEFDITFNCKPQRFLKSGETQQSVVNGGNLLNPTLFESNPLVMVQGYGTLNIGDKSVRVDSVPIGNILLSNGEQLKDTTTGTSSNMVTVGTIEFDETKMNSGDIITLLPTEYTINVTNNNQYSDEYVEINVTNQTGAGETVGTVLSTSSAAFTTTFAPIPFTVGTAASVSHSYDITFDVITPPSGHITSYMYPVITIAYDGAGTITVTAKHIYKSGMTIQTSGSTGELNGYSTVTASGTIYIDLDIGEAYWLRSSTVISANYAVHLGADLPTLKPGSNTITFDNTFTSVKFIPRWWKI